MDEKSLRWRCRRGMRELDVLLTHYLDHHYPSAKPAEQTTFKALLDLQDPQIFAYLIGKEMPQDASIATLVRSLRRRD